MHHHTPGGGGLFQFRTRGDRSRELQSTVFSLPWRKRSGRDHARQEPEGALPGFRRRAEQIGRRARSHHQQRQKEDAALWWQTLQRSDPRCGKVHSFTEEIGLLWRFPKKRLGVPPGRFLFLLPTCKPALKEKPPSLRLSLASISYRLAGLLVLVFVDALADPILLTIDPFLLRLGEMALLLRHFLLFTLLYNSLALLDFRPLLLIQFPALHAVPNPPFLVLLALVYFIDPWMAGIDNARARTRGAS